MNDMPKNTYYNIVVMHGPVVTTEYLGNNTVVYTLDNGNNYTIKFSDCGDGENYKRTIADDEGNVYVDIFDMTGFGNFSLEDLAQWTADNWCEIDEIIKYEKAR